MMGSRDDAPTTWHRDPALPFQSMDDEIIVVDPATRQVHLLNNTAARIWSLLASAQSLPALVAALEDEFDAAPGVLRAEVEAVLTEMADKHLCASRGTDAALPPQP